jgi:hypothetical protein
MLQLTPLRETTSFQEELKEYNVEMLTKQIRHKFHFAESTIEKLTVCLQQLSLQELETLFEDILDIRNLKQLNAWLDKRLLEKE